MAAAIPTTYPLVHCDRHEAADASGYVVCPHVAHERAHPTVVITATALELGHVLCMTCAAQTNGAALPEPELTCAACAREQGWLTAVATA